MPGTFTNAGKHAMLDGSAAAAGITHVEAYDGDPEGAGNPVGSGRVAISFAAASGGAKAASNQPALSIGAGETVSWLAYYDASSGGTLRAKEDVTDEAFGNAGTYTVTSASLSV